MGTTPRPPPDRPGDSPRCLRRAGGGNGVGVGGRSATARSAARPELRECKPDPGAARKARPVPVSPPRPGEGSQPGRAAATLTCQAGSAGALTEDAGAGPAQGGRELGAGTEEEVPCLPVWAAPVAPGRQFDFRAWPQVDSASSGPRKSRRGRGRERRDAPGPTPSCIRSAPAPARPSPPGPDPAAPGRAARTQTCRICGARAVCN